MNYISLTMALLTGVFCISSVQSMENRSSLAATNKEALEKFNQALLAYEGNPEDKTLINAIERAYNEIPKALRSQAYRTALDSGLYFLDAPSQTEQPTGRKRSHEQIDLTRSSDVEQSYEANNGQHAPTKPCSLEDFTAKLLEYKFANTNPTPKEILALYDRLAPKDRQAGENDLFEILYLSVAQLRQSVYGSTGEPVQCSEQNAKRSKYMAPPGSPELLGILGLDDVLDTAHPFANHNPAQSPLGQLQPLITSDLLDKSLSNITHNVGSKLLIPTQWQTLISGFEKITTLDHFHEILHALSAANPEEPLLAQLVMLMLRLKKMLTLQATPPDNAEVTTMIEAATAVLQENEQLQQENKTLLEQVAHWKSYFEQKNK